VLLTVEHPFTNAMADRRTIHATQICVCVFIGEMIPGRMPRNHTIVQFADLFNRIAFPFTVTVFSE